MFHKVLLGRKLLGLNSLRFEGHWEAGGAKAQHRTEIGHKSRCIFMDTSTEHHHLLQGISIPREWGVISWSSSGGPVFLSHSGSPRNLWAFWILGLQVASLCKKNNNRHNLYKKKRRNKTCSSPAPELEFPSPAGQQGTVFTFWTQFPWGCNGHFWILELPQLLCSGKAWTSWSLSATPDRRCQPQLENRYIYFRC